MMKYIIIFLAFIALFQSPAIAENSGNLEKNESQKIGPSGNPLPRFVSLSAKKAYLRTGPGRQYPIDWVYSRPGFPLEIIDEHGPWRKVRDHEGIKGWMLVSLLFGNRTAMIMGKARQLHEEDDLSSHVTVIAEPGVIGTIIECRNLWCRLNIDGDKAWIERRHLWGVYSHEELD